MAKKKTRKVPKSKTRKPPKKVVKRTKAKTKRKKTARREDTRHLACPNYPNCETEGCGPPDDDGHTVEAPVKVMGAPLSTKVTKPNPKFSVWENAKCGTCGYDGSNDPNGENYLYKLTCPDCGREGCDECIPSGRGCPCPECEDSERDESNANIDEDAGDDIVDDDPTDDEG